MHAVLQHRQSKEKEKTEMKIKLTHNLIIALGREVATKRMKLAKRKRWNTADLNYASRVVAPLFKIFYRNEITKDFS